MSSESEDSELDSGRSTPEEIRRIAENVWNNVRADKYRPKPVARGKRAHDQDSDDSSQEPANKAVKSEPAAPSSLETPKVESSDDEEYITVKRYEHHNTEKLVASKKLSEKSVAKYQREYDKFRFWLDECKYSEINENVLLMYFDHLSQTSKPKTMWLNYTFLKATIYANDDIDIASYCQLRNTLKGSLNDDSEEKTSSYFTEEQIKSFLTDAPDAKFLALKVVLIIGVTGAFRAKELSQITTNNIEMHDDVCIVKSPNPRTHVMRTFTIEGENFEIVKKYYAKRPKGTETNRLFLKYHNGKCARQVIGIQKIANAPKRIAEVLQLPNPNSYTGIAFYKTALIHLARSGASMDEMIKYGGFTSRDNARRFVNLVTGTTARGRKKSCGVLRRDSSRRSYRTRTRASSSENEYY